MKAYLRNGVKIRAVNDALSRYGFELVNPFNGLAAGEVDPRQVIEENRRLLEQSDVLLANMGRRTYGYVGAVFEIAHAAFLRCPIVVYMGQNDLGGRLYFPHYCGFMCETLDDALQYLWRCCSQTGIDEQLREQMAYYDAVAHVYDDKVREVHRRAVDDSESYMEERTQLQDKLKEHCRGRAVLELGCGDGDWTRFIADVATSVSCVDSSAKMINEAKRRLRRCANRPEFSKANVLSECFAPRTCDVVVCYFLLALLPPVCQKTATLGNAKVDERCGPFSLC